MIKSRRSKLLIDKKFQISFILKTSLLSFLTVTLFHSVNMYFFYQLRKEGLSFGLSEDHLYFQFIRDQKNFLTSLYLGGSLLMIVVFFIFGLVYSHRIVGPVCRLRSYLQELREREEVAPLFFRTNDYFQDVALKLNATIAHLKNKGRDIDNKK